MGVPVKPQQPNGAVFACLSTTRTARGARKGGSRRGGEEERTGTGPIPPDLPRALRTHEQGTAPAKAVVVHSATHQPLG